ncbi:MAG: hypothetical protein JW974_03095 [Alphaproteobacteria bacterium]|nr:hypothetical protein [Alphaproteobacteria bacterium]MBN2674917.1 hypothetical protein [Alphaproteobacteria bacterium]
MRMKFAGLLTIISCLCAGSASANWQYPGQYVGDGWYQDNGSRFVLSFRGGASFMGGSVSNEVNSLTTGYYVSSVDGSVISEGYYYACTAAGGCGDFAYAGLGDIAKLPGAKDFSEYSFAAGASVGFTVENFPQWRMELGWDHISETEYNAAPLFEGDLTLEGGPVDNVVVSVKSSSAQSTINTDIISAMAFYDFFDGMQKPLHQMIPYIGFGMGYADIKTVLNMADLYGDLSLDVDLQNYGELDSYNVIQFYKSEKSSSNIAGLLAVGFSYGLSENMYLDFGARLTWVPEIKWALSNEDATKTRDWFSAKNVMYTNIMMGIRFEF